MATTYLTRTLGTPTDNLKWTFSAWIKRSAISGDNPVMSIGGDTSAYTRINFNGNGQIEFDNNPSGFEGRKMTSSYQRDPAAWYHVVVIYDSANGTPGDRMIIYINGSRVTAFGTDADPDASTASGNTSGETVRLGILDTGTYFSGAMAHAHFCDGQAYAASTFGETDSTSGIWFPISSPSVTYGNNGFFAKFSDGATLTDSSGEGNDFTLGGGTVTALKDSPDNNFCTMNPVDNYFANQTFTNTNNTVKSDHPAPAVSTMGLTSGKWYFEGKAIVSTSGSDWQFGLVSKQRTASEQEIGNFPSEYSYRGSNGYIRTDNSETTYGATYTTGDIIGCAVDLTNLKLYFSKNGVWQNSGVPTSGATGTGAISITAPASTLLEAYFPAAGADASANDYTWSMNFGNGYWGTTSVGATNEDDAGIGVFAYDVPAGYYAICTDNLGDQS